jgi:hypothetical protein
MRSLKGPLEVAIAEKQHNTKNTVHSQEAGVVMQVTGVAICVT